MSAADLAGEVNSTEGLFGVGAKTEAAITFGAFTGSGDTVSLSVAGIQITNSDNVETTGDATVASLKATIDGSAAIKEALAAKGITYSVNTPSGAGTSDDSLVFTNSTGENIEVTLAVAGAASTDATAKISAWDGTATTGNDVDVTAAADETKGTTTTVTGNLDFSDAVLAADAGTLTITGSGALGGGGGETKNTSTKWLNVADLDISTAGGSQSAIDVIDAALKNIDSERADLGAVQNRFDHTISNLANISENVSASRSRIQDTDFATETAQMTKNQILQQAGTSILSQANQLPQAALSLLG
ncbi:MAG: flagellin [Enterobacterales bacterium]